MWAIYRQKTIKQSAKTLQKIRQAGECTYSSKKQKKTSKQANKSCAIHMSQHAEKCRNHNCKKTALLISWLQHQKKKY